MKKIFFSDERFGIKGDFLFLFMLLCVGYKVFISFAAEMTGDNIVDDPDQDGLTTSEERLYGTDPNRRDTDNDGYSDAVEIFGGYDPLKKAPGDKIVAESTNEGGDSGQGGDNLTEEVSKKIANIVKSSESNAEGNTEVGLEELNALAQEIALGGSEEIILPEIDLSLIRIKDQSYPKMSAEKREDRIREDIVEYLTTVSYIFANNSPKPFGSEEELESISDSLIDEAISSFSSGSLSRLQSFASNGESMLSEIEQVEVPEEMLDVHVKALKLAKYATSLKDEVAVSDVDDPVKTIRTLSKSQGFLNVVISFVADVQSKIEQYEIEEIPLDL
ncbi:MAG: hypothetical protein HGA33_01840 [Candidatus Moranbacteria bacterium]|nr:hypothetical protein [Candidatus Moranbacteria bacterium]